jgi:hypothetical protein
VSGFFSSSGLTLFVCSRRRKEEEEEMLFSAAFDDVLD